MDLFDEMIQDFNDYEKEAEETKQELIEAKEYNRQLALELEEKNKAIDIILPELEKKDKVIDLIVNTIVADKKILALVCKHIINKTDEECEKQNSLCDDCIKEYFYKKVSDNK